MNDDGFGRKSDKVRGSKGRLRARCPACSAAVVLRDAAEVWDLIRCPECRTRLEIVALRPATLDYADGVQDRKLVMEDDEDEG